VLSFSPTDAVFRQLDRREAAQRGANRLDQQRYALQVLAAIRSSPHWA
jgi:hypothetical protein